MTTNAIFCAGLVIGGILGAVLGYLFAWDEANEMFEKRWQRWRDRYQRVTGKHYYR